MVMLVMTVMTATPVMTVIFAAQVIGARVKEKYGLTSEDIAQAVAARHSVLATDQEFVSLNIKLQQTIAQRFQQEPVRVEDKLSPQVAAEIE